MFGFSRYDLSYDQGVHIWAACDLELGKDPVFRISDPDRRAWIPCRRAHRCNHPARCHWRDRCDAYEATAIRLSSIA